MPGAWVATARIVEYGDGWMFYLVALPPSAAEADEIVIARSEFKYRDYEDAVVDVVALMSGGWVAGGGELDPRALENPNAAQVQRSPIGREAVTVALLDGMPTS